MSNSKTVSTEIITIAGGAYHEIILYPEITGFTVQREGRHQHWQRSV
ncbi:hypothetical protein [Klebsiella quasipneumoniae]